MLRKLNTYFLAKGKLLTEREYMAESDVPFRLTTIQKFIGRWPRMISFLQYYYPGWRAETVEEPVAQEETKVSEEPKKLSGLEALKAKADEPTE